MILNNWWDRAGGRLVNCTDEDSASLIGVAGRVDGVGQSATRLLSTTLPDELQLQLPGPTRVVSLSMKARSAINLGGHHPDAVAWLDEKIGEWVTSTAFAPALEPFVANYVRAHEMRNELGRTWERAMPRERYLFDEVETGRQKGALGTVRFPHAIRGGGEGIDESFVAAWESSPYSDEYVTGLVLAAIDTLGTGNGTDLLAVSYAALDKVGHDFGPESHEVQDILFRLDRQLGSVLDALDRKIGAGNYVVALSADHGVSAPPDQLKARGVDAGRVSLTRLTATLDAALQPVLGPGKYVARIAHSDIFFMPGVYARLQTNAAAMETILRTLRDTPGIWRVYSKETLANGLHDADPILRSAAGSYFEGRSGDLIMLPRAYWILSDSTTTHGTGHRYDTRVPILLYGFGIRPGQYLAPAAPIDIAPTLAMLASVTLPDPMGRVLIEALQH
jgi:hypothetical protein